MLKRIRDKLADERGATAVEYSLLVVGIAAVIVLSVVSLGGATNSSLDCAGKSWQNGTSACSAADSSSVSTPTPTVAAPTPTPTSGNGNGNAGGNNGNGGAGQGNGNGNGKK